MRLFGRKKDKSNTTPAPIERPEAYENLSGEAPEPVMSDRQMLEQCLTNQKVIAENAQVYYNNTLQALDKLYAEMLRLSDEDAQEDDEDVDADEKESASAPKKTIAKKKTTKK